WGAPRALPPVEVAGGLRGGGRAPAPAEHLGEGGRAPLLPLLPPGDGGRSGTRGDRRGPPEREAPSAPLPGADRVRDQPRSRPARQPDRQGLQDLDGGGPEGARPAGHRSAGTVLSRLASRAPGSDRGRAAPTPPLRVAPSPGRRV